MSESENRLHDFHSSVVETLRARGESFNWHCDLVFPAVDLQRMRMPDVADEASQWRQQTPAADMYFSHGQYYKDGIEHIISELKGKRTSNRALYSLLSQKDISGSGDEPRPSFLTFQCSIEGGVLYSTAAFRALEVGKFLKVNLEEIRQNLVDIHRSFPDVETVHLHIFAFHAYIQDAAVVALRRPAIDVIHEAELLILMQKGDLRTLDGLLGGLQRSTTAVSSEKLRALLRILDMTDANLHIKVVERQDILKPLVKRSIELCDELAESRKGASRGRAAKEKIEGFQNAVRTLRDSLLK